MSELHAVNNPESKTFRDSLEELINRYPMENGLDTPDWILAQYLCECLDAYGKATGCRERWYGRGKWA